MIHAIERTDGGVSIMTMLPSHITVAGTTYAITRVMKTDGGLRFGIAMPEDAQGEGSIDVTFAGDVADLEAGSIPGVTLAFPKVEDEIAKWPSDQQALVVAHHPVTSAQLPADRTFRNAWKHHATKGIDHDMPKARNIWRDHMREVRAAKLTALDADYMRADEAGNNQLKAQIAAKKQVLRDVTADPAIEAAQTPEALKAVWPAALGG